MLYAADISHNEVLVVTNWNLIVGTTVPSELIKFVILQFGPQLHGVKAIYYVKISKFARPGKKKVLNRLSLTAPVMGYVKTRQIVHYFVSDIGVI